jgi:molecular chaperone DnaJ
MPRDYYDILGVAKNASDDDIKRAFRKLAHEHHPDKPGGNVEKFKEINAAYQALGDAEKRRRYDQFGHAAENMGGAGGNPFGGFGGQGQQFDMNDLGDIFGDMFGMGGQARGGGRRGPPQGGNIQMDVTITFAESAFGVSKDLRVYKTLRCEDCDASGAEKGTKRVSCSQCNGSGQMRQVRQTILGAMQVQTTCSKCGGEGSQPEKACKRCTGTTKGEREISLQIPAGIDDGEVLRVTGEGEAAARGGRPGDLFLNVRVKADVRFEREGFDVRSVVDIPVSLAALGGTVSAETVDGAVDLKIPAGTQPGTLFRLRNKGITHLRRSGRGDHIVTVNVRIPRKLSREQKKALEDWGEEF